MTDMIPDLLAKLEAVDQVATHLNGRIDELRTDMRAESDSILERQHQRTRRLWIGLVVVALIVAGLIWALERQQKILDQQGRINATQTCINRANDARERDAILFYIAEYKKVNDQYVGMLRLRNASIKGDKKAAYAGFNTFLGATGHYRDGEVAKKLAELGVKIVKHGDGTVDLVAPNPKTVTAGCN